MKETREKEVCPVCNGTGNDFRKSIEYEKETGVTARFRCKECGGTGRPWGIWLESQRETNKMIVEKIPLSEVGDPWGMQPDGNYRQEPRAFFDIVGVNIQAKREVPFWSQPIIKELGKGIVVLVKSKNKEGDLIFLLTSKPEPGNPTDKNFVLLKPTIQASESNMARAHSGEKPPFAELLDKYGNSIIWIELPQDGGRSLGKVNKYAVMEITTEDAKEIVLPPDARWFRLEEISEALFNGDVNEHLSQALALERLLMS